MEKEWLVPRRVQDDHGTVTMRWVRTENRPASDDEYQGTIQERIAAHRERESIYARLLRAMREPLYLDMIGRNEWKTLRHEESAAAEAFQSRNLGLLQTMAEHAENPTHRVRRVRDVYTMMEDRGIEGPGQYISTKSLNLYDAIWETMDTVRFYHRDADVPGVLSFALTVSEDDRELVKCLVLERQPKSAGELQDMVDEAKRSHQALAAGSL